MRTTTSAILLIAAAFWPATVLGFGVLGHQVVAALAQDMLTPKAKAAVSSLLVTAGPGGSQSDLAGISLWADEVRMLRPETRTWHYVTLQLDEPGYNPAQGDSANVVVACRRALATLARADADRYVREEALKWAVHLVGDMHQPLHVGEDRDKGGNLRKVKVGRRTYNLHQVWDYVLLERLHLGRDTLKAMLVAEIAADPRFLARSAKGTVVDWVDETHLKSRECYLVRGKPMRKGIALSLERDYVRPNTLMVLGQLKLAGVRLAAALNAALDPRAPPVPALSSSHRGGAPPVPDAYFARADDPAAPGGSPAPAGMASTGRFAWSIHSHVYHFAQCTQVARIKRGNLRFADLPPPGLTLHAGCPSSR